MNIQTLLKAKVKEGFLSLFSTVLPTVEFLTTRKDFEGDLTIVLFPMLRYQTGNPVEIGQKLGKYLVENTREICTYNVVKGFLNLVISDRIYLESFNALNAQEKFGYSTSSKEAILVEYSSPNTNKPLHLGHIRNNLLGYSVAEILKASGKKVYKTQIINDRGIHICKSMVAWQKFGNSDTPEVSGIKGDHFVGKYYTKFNDVYKKQLGELVAEGIPEEEAKMQAPILMEAQQMLLKWEAGDADTTRLWKKMNQWVYEGFKITYENLGVDFDTLYYESTTYLLGKDVVSEGLKKGIFFKKEDGSIWCDLNDEGLDEKLVLRADGTSVYMTQDIGTAIQRVKDHSDINGMVYTVGNEQDYHFKVLFLILKKLGFVWAKKLYHLSYGMVDLPSGKMKSREGTVVDADQLMIEMRQTAENISKELGKLEGYSEQEKVSLYHMIGMGALKYFILKVDPKKRILFDPKASVDFQGNTGPFIQYTYARIQSILRRASFDYKTKILNYEFSLHPKEKGLIKKLEMYPGVVQQAASIYSPAIVANYTYDLVKEFNSFYQNVSILGEPLELKKKFRVQLANKVACVIKSAFGLLGIQVPNKM